jgi:hypothetical protein
MSPVEWCQWLQHTRFATAITESDWLFPLIEGSHILALPLSVGMIVIADLRLLGLAFCGEATGKVVPSFLRLSRIGFPVMFLTGGLLFITQAGKAYGNPFFRAKLIFLLLLGINAAVYQKLLYPKMAGWDSAGGAPAGAKFCAAFSLVLWIGVIVCGRTMAYQF